MSFSVCPVSLPISQNRSKLAKKRNPLSCIRRARWSFEPSVQQSRRLWVFALTTVPRFRPDKTSFLSTHHERFAVVLRTNDYEIRLAP